MIQTDGYNSIDPYVDGYMEQEEEWEREGLLDPAWEKQQKKGNNHTVSQSNTSDLLDMHDIHNIRHFRVWLILSQPEGTANPD
ncbi:hypothetical protein GWI33_015253 [Rhynchophorus ferrugineus]|uniref:Uncharacterized protein n=1 Tax=Rhynchophorus ferrugineus TaxID=354439 RepID=A0A834I3P6_RHYFE|nr:hypothetical protein GWI33_015253 [Rhynchophorus ferrugineus]